MVSESKQYSNCVVDIHSFKEPPASDLDVSRDFAGVNGKLDLSQALDRQEVLYFRDEFDGRRYQGRDDSPAWVRQLIRPGLARKASPVIRDSEAVAWAGTIWDIPGRDEIESEPKRYYSYLHQALVKDDFTPLKQIDGDFVGSIVTPNEALLVRSIESRTPLYFRVAKQSLSWSTNYLDLVDPLSEIDVDRLAICAWGASIIPYRKVQALKAGSYVRFKRNGVNHGVYDSLLESSVSTKMSLSDWGDYCRDLLFNSIRKRAKRFRNVGVLLSGGIDSAAVARCLVDLGANVTCYHYASPSYPPADETDYARAVCDYLDVPLTIINVSDDRLPGGKLLDPSWRFHVPHNHTLFGHWKRFVDVVGTEIDCVFSGAGGDAVFGAPGFRIWSAIAGSRLRDLPTLLKHTLSVPSFPTNDPHLGTVPPARRFDYYTEESSRAVHKYISEQGIGRSDEVGGLYNTSIDIDLLRPRGLVALVPYASREMKVLRRDIPYSRLPFGGEFVPKPILRMAFLDQLPARTIQRWSPPHLGGVMQEFCLNNKDVIRTIVTQGSKLSKMGIIDHGRLLNLMGREQSLRSNARTIIANSLVSLWFDFLS